MLSSREKQHVLLASAAFYLVGNLVWWLISISTESPRLAQDGQEDIRDIVSTPAELTIDTVQEPAAESMPLALAHQQQEADETYGSMLTPAVTAEDIHLDAIAKLSTRVSLKLHHWRAAAHKQKTHVRLLEDQLWRAETSEQNLAEELDNLRQKTNEGLLQLQHWQAVAYQQGLKLRDTEAHGQRIQNKLQHCIYAVQHLKARHRLEALIQNRTRRRSCIPSASKSMTGLCSWSNVKLIN